MSKFTVPRQQVPVNLSPGPRGTAYKVQALSKRGHLVWSGTVYCESPEKAIELVKRVAKGRNAVKFNCETIKVKEHVGF